MKTVFNVEIKFEGVNERDYKDFMKEIRDIAHDFCDRYDEQVADVFEVDGEE